VGEAGKLVGWGRVRVWVWQENWWGGAGLGVGVAGKLVGWRRVRVWKGQ
jgi:hypothetical protein